MTETNANALADLLEQLAAEVRAGEINLRYYTINHEHREKWVDGTHITLEPTGGFTLTIDAERHIPQP